MRTRSLLARESVTGTHSDGSTCSCASRDATVATARGARLRPILRAMSRSGLPAPVTERRAWESVRERLHDRGLRWTPQRRTLVTVLSETHGHVTGAELVERCRQRDPATIPSTVYRTLDVLEELGIVRHGHGADGREEYHVLPRGARPPALRRLRRAGRSARTRPRHRPFRSSAAASRSTSPTSRSSAAARVHRAWCGCLNARSRDPAGVRMGLPAAAEGRAGRRADPRRRRRCGRRRLDPGVAHPRNVPPRRTTSRAGRPRRPPRPERDLHGL